MANKLQKLIYNLSAVAPLCLVFSWVWYMQKKTYIYSFIFIIIAFILVFALVCSFSYSKKNIAPIQIRACEISPNDGWIITYIISYMIPLVSMVIEEFDLLLCSAIAFLLVLIAPYVNTAVPNPLLFFRGYHFYQISAENGVSGYVLISKRKLRRKQDLKQVRRVFEFLLLDTERR